VTPIPDDLNELLRLAYLNEAAPNSLLRRLAAAVEGYFDSESEAETELQEKLDAAEKTLQQAAQRGWGQAFCEVEEIVRAAIDTTLDCDSAVERLEDVLEEIEGRASNLPDPHDDTVADRASDPIAREPKPRPNARKPASPKKPLETAVPTGRGGKHQQTVLAFLQAAGGTATRKATREHLMQAGVGGGEPGAYGVINRMIFSDRVNDLGNDLIGLPAG
jgi:hypothetical protein